MDDGLNPPITSKISHLTDYFRKNSPPEFNSRAFYERIEAVQILEGQYFSITWDEALFMDNHAESLVYEMYLDDNGRNTNLPAWLTFRDLALRGTPPKKSIELFLKYQDRLFQEWQGLTDVELTARALVPSMQGLEDSSRYWSIADTARHLWIVAHSIEPAIIKLSQGSSIPTKIGTADVKPEREQNSASAVHNYETFSKGLMDRLHAQVKDWDSPALMKHPWFGPLRARDWLWVLGAHSKIHLNQIRAIKKELGLSSVSLAKTSV
ncbi:MAG: hypothetical protein EOP04_27650 [Proteobacteria bacterium]|nr:MAG: hypothetical protein EOP04_27650 [Pseudomonadota bacterium]